MLLRDRLAFFRLGMLGIVAVAAPRNHGLASVLHIGHSGLPSLDILALIVIGIAVLLAIFARKRRLLAGLFLALLGNVAVSLLLRRRFALGTSLAAIAPWVVLAALLCLGLQWMLAGSNLAAYWSRFGFLVASFLLPPLAFIGLFNRHAWFRPYWLDFMIPGLAATLLVSLRRGGHTAGGPPGWNAIVRGAAISLLLGFGLREGRQMILRAKMAADRAVLQTMPQVPADTPYPKTFFQKGVNFTAEFPATYDSGGARRMLLALRADGMNAVALVPYGWFSGNPPKVRIQGPDGWENDIGLQELARLAHANGMKVFLKPAIWRAQNLKFTGTQERAEWFAQYRLFVQHYAQLATRIHADLFSIGGELVHLTRDDADWRALVAQVRRWYPGPIVYAANFGEEFEHIQFWDALDAIGLQEYYPLPANLSTASVFAKVEAVQQKFHLPVIFTEAGFPSLEQGNRWPWNDSRQAPVALELQKQCYEALFRAFYNQPWFEGMYWWKVGTNGYGGAEDGSLTPWNKPAMLAVQHWYAQGRTNQPLFSR